MIAIISPCSAYFSVIFLRVNVNTARHSDMKLLRHGYGAPHLAYHDTERLIALHSLTAMSLPPQLLHTLENLKYQAKDAFWALSSCICQQSAKIKINGRTCK